MLESSYEECLCYELKERCLKYERQKTIPVVYKEVRLECRYKADLIVENIVIVELKSIEGILPIHEAQILTYLKFAQKKIGLLINFNVTVLKNGIGRFVL